MPPDQRAKVELWYEGNWVQDAHDGEPSPTEPDLHISVDGIDAEALGRLGPKDSGRVLSGCLVEPCSGGYRGANGVEQVGTHRVGPDSAGLGGRDLIGTVYLRVRELPDPGDGLDSSDPANHRDRLVRQGGVLAEQGEAWPCGEEVRTECI